MYIIDENLLSSKYNAKFQHYRRATISDMYDNIKLILKLRIA